MSYLDENYSGWFFKVWQNGMQPSGIPDIIGVLDGRFIGIEVKVNNNKSSRIQDNVRELIINSGGLSVVCYSLDQLKEQLNDRHGEQATPLQ